jgi:hemolysin III
MMDQVCIFLLIAGSFTPFGLTYLRDGWMLGILFVMWGLAFFGVFFKVAYSQLDNVSTSTYVVMGWLPIVAIEQIVTRFPGMALAWIVAGGLCYTIGTWFLTYDYKARYFHAVWHLLVIAGSACHYIAVRQYVLI